MENLNDSIALAEQLKSIQAQIPFKVSARGWCYLLESFNRITKADFDAIEGRINRCRDRGYLPIDFVAEEDARKFTGVEIPNPEDPIAYLRSFLQQAMRAEDYYTPDWWNGEEHYIQMVVEKIDLKTLFEPVCQEYHIPIATSKGWASKLQRAEYARRFKEAEERGLGAVLLYCGDHDPDGLRISTFLRENLEQLNEVVWSDGTSGYDPADLIIDRFGLNYDFIEANNLTWIDNLITGSKKDLADPSHPNHKLPYVQDYLRRFGVRKCEANALIVIPNAAEQLCRGVIEGYLGSDARGRFWQRRQKILELVGDFRRRTGLSEALNEAMRIIDLETGE